jgi:hypothetical protein
MREPARTRCHQCGRFCAVRYGDTCRKCRIAHVKRTISLTLG